MLLFLPLLPSFLFALSSFYVLLLTHLPISFPSNLSFLPLIQPFPHSLSSFHILISSSHLSQSILSLLPLIQSFPLFLSSLHTLLLMPSSLPLIPFFLFLPLTQPFPLSFPSPPHISLSIHSLIAPSHTTLHSLPLVVTHSPFHPILPSPFHCFLSFFSFIQPSPHPILTSPSHSDFSFLSFIAPFPLPLILLPSPSHPISFHSLISPSHPTLTSLPLMSMPTLIHHSFSLILYFSRTVCSVSVKFILSPISSFCVPEILLVSI